MIPKSGYRFSEKIMLKHLEPVEPCRRGSVVDPRQPEKDKPMLRKFAVALLAASVFTAPVLAQGGGSTATPPATTEIKSDSAAPKVTASPSLKTAKHKTSKRYAHRHVKHKHVAHVKRVKHVKAAHAVHGTKGDKQTRDASKSTTGQNGASPASKAKSNVN
jgi:hypothetical protein